MMRKSVMTPGLVLFAATAMFICAGGRDAQAQSRTFVKSTGSDANPCNPASPCRTLQRGINAVAAGGDVLIQDSGGFGTNVLITKSVSVIAEPGTLARIAADYSPGVTINGAGINVSLTNIGISGVLGNEGIKFLSGSALSLRNMDIYVTDGGTAVSHTAGGGHLIMTDSVTRRSNRCVTVEGPSPSSLATATITGSRAEGCNYGFQAFGNSLVTIENSVAMGTRTPTAPAINEAGCSTNFDATSGGAMVLDNVVSSRCSYGLAVTQAGSVLSVSNSIVTGNDFAGLAGFGGLGKSFATNHVFGNNSEALQGFTSVARQ